MDATGLIFAVLVLACLFYIVPRQLSWRIPSTPEESDRKHPLHLSMKTVHAGIKPSEPGEPAEVSTILMRRAGRRAVLKLARRAERWRRGVFVALLLVLMATIPFAVLSMIRWWVPVGAAVVVAGWIVYSHIEARRFLKQLNALIAEVELGDDEKTVAVELAPRIEESAAEPGIVGPNGDIQLSLWEPITVVPATYMSGPTRGHQVRTIDLGAPIPKLPVTDDGPAEERRAAAG